MSVTVLAPTPVLPPVRRASVWEKMFGNFKMGKHEEDYESNSPLPSPGLPHPRIRLASVSTGVEKTNAYKRTASIAMAKDTRSVSAPVSAPLVSPSKSRTPSISTRRSSKSGRRSSWWRSANPETEEDVPAVPSIDRKFSSIFGSHNPDEPESASPAPSPTASRRPSYVPRNAASSFLRTTTPLSSEEKAEVIRRASVADALASKPPRPVSISQPSRPVSMSHKPAPLNLKLSNDNLNQYNLSTTDANNGLLTPGLVSPGLVSPRGGTFSIASGPLSPADTIMEVDSDEGQVDSAKASPSLSAVKSTANVSIVELAA